MATAEELEAKYSKLIDQLISGTRTGRIQWSRTADPDSFRASLKKGMIRVGRVTLYREDEPGDITYTLTLIDGNVREIGEYSSEESEKSLKMLFELWSIARHTAHDTSGVLDQLIAETA